MSATANEWRARACRSVGDASSGRDSPGGLSPTGDGARVFLLHSQGYVRALDVTRDGDEVTLAPAGGDVGLPIAVNAARPVMAALGDRFVALGDTDRLIVLAWTQRSARMFQLVEEGIGIPTMLALEPDPLNPNGFIEARELFATLERREVYVGERVPDPEVPDVGVMDTGGMDTGGTDAGVMDAGPDASMVDVGVSIDASVADADAEDG